MESGLAFEDLVERYSEPLYRFAMSLARTQMDAEDLVQQTFLTWAEKGHQLRDLSKVKSWLFTTLHRAHLRMQRRVVRFPEVELEEAAHEEGVVEPTEAPLLDGEDLLKLIGELEEEYRAAVALFYLEDCSYEEISEALEIPVGTVKSRLSRGITRLKQSVARRLKGEAEFRKGVVR